MIPLPPTDEGPRPLPRLRWKHGSVPVLGLIGGIGGGKSAAARLLADRGAAVIDADAVGHELLEDPAIRARILDRFGAGVLEVEVSPTGESTGQDTRISRRALAAVVFADDRALRDLESILHPAMRDRFRRAIEHLAREGRTPCIVLDAAVLLEAGWDDLCDLVIYVEAPRPDRLRRVLQSRGWSEAMLDARERSQWPLLRKARCSDWVINNDGDMDRLGREVDRILARLRGPDLLLAVWAAARTQDAPAPAEVVLGSPVTPGRTS